jgi:hypothetical protein
MEKKCSSDDGADVRFLVGGEVVEASRSTLSAHSEAFRAMFAPDRFLEGSSSPAASADAMLEVKLADVDPEAFRFLVEIVHDQCRVPSWLLGRAPEDAGVMTLLAMANRFLVDAVEQTLRERLERACVPATALALLSAMLEHGVPCCAMGARVQRLIEDADTCASVLHRADLARVSADAMAVVLRSNLWLPEIDVFRFLRQWCFLFFRRQHNLSQHDDCDDDKDDVIDGDGNEEDDDDEDDMARGGALDDVVEKMDRSTCSEEENGMIDALLDLIDFRLIAAAELKAVVEPSGLLSQGRLLDAYRFAATHHTIEFKHLGRSLGPPRAAQRLVVTSLGQRQHGDQFEWAVRVVKEGAGPELKFSVHLVILDTLLPGSHLHGRVRLERGIEALLYRDRRLLSHVVSKKSRCVSLGDSIRLGNCVEWSAGGADNYLTVLIHLPPSCCVVGPDQLE